MRHHLIKGLIAVLKDPLSTPIAEWASCTTSIVGPRRRKMKPKRRKSLPKSPHQITNGGVYKQWVKCGNPGCRCSRGHKHLAHYFFTRRNGKRIKTYIRKSELDDFTELVEAAKEIRKRRSQRTDRALTMLSKMRVTLHKNDPLINELKRSTNAKKED